MGNLNILFAQMSPCPDHTKKTKKARQRFSLAGRFVLECLRAVVSPLSQSGVPWNS
jgi:hypothetical protein